MKKPTRTPTTPLAGRVSARKRGPIGGSANAAGAQYGASVAAWACCRALLGSRAALPWDLAAEAYVSAVSSECEEEVDDLQLTLGPEGRVYIQIKHGLRMDSEFDKGIAQLARQFATTRLGLFDRLVLVTDATASSTVRHAVPKVFSWFRGLPTSTPLALFPHGNAARDALIRIERVFEGQYVKSTGTPATEAEWRRFLSITYLTELNTLDHGTDQLASLDVLKRVSSGSGPTQAWTGLNTLALQGSRLRRPLDAAAIRSALSRDGILLDLDEAGDYATVESSVRRMAHGHIVELQRRGQYVRENYVERSGIEKQLRRNSGTRNITVIVGGSGNGKTTWCASKCDVSEPPLRILLPAESIQESDLHLRMTLRRLIDASSNELAAASYSPAELHTWLKATPLEIFVDGLDRVHVTQRKLVSWLERTSADIQDLNWRMTATTRPEIKSIVEHAFGDSAVLVEVGGYSEVEALLAARRLGVPALAKYRNPRMMSFCARLWATHGSEAFRHEEAVEHFVAETAARAARDSDLLLDAIELALQDLALALARSETGALVGESSRDFRLAHAAAYEAMRKENLLISASGAVRVDIDDVAEHLAGRHTDAAAEASRWNEIRSVPLKAGALRAALEQLAVKSPTEAARCVRDLAHASAVEADSLLASMLCAVTSAFEDLSAVKDVVTVLLRTWRKENFLAGWGAGFDLLNLADNNRWAPMERVELLWLLAPMENGLDWRSKHWLKPHIYSSYEVTPWRSRFLVALQQAGLAGWTFLSNYFDSDVSLVGSDEAKLGDLAQGAFVATACDDVPRALAFSDEIRNDKTRERLLSWLACRYPLEIRDLFLKEETSLTPGRRVEVALEMRDDDWSPHPAMADLAAHWLARQEFLPYRRSLLRVVARSGNAAAAAELMACADLDSTEIGAVFSLDLPQFKHTLADLLSTRSDLEVVSDGLASENMRIEHVAVIAAHLPRFLRDEQSGRSVARLCEHMLYVCISAGECPKELLQLARAVLQFPSAGVRSYLIYPASTTRGSPHRSDGGAALQMQLLELIMEFEANLKNLNTLYFKLMENHSSNSAIMAYCEELTRRHPGLAADDGPEHGFLHAQ